MKKYYIHNGANQIGPFTLEELKTKNISSNTPVWYEGIDKWTIAGNVVELKEIFDTVKPPPFVQSTPPTYSVPSIPKATQQQQTNYPTPQKKKNNAPIIVTVIVVVLAIFGVISLKNNPNSVPGIKFELNTPKPRVLSQSADKANSDIKMRVTVYSNILNEGGAGNVLVTFHITQGANTFDRTRIVSFSAGESKNVEATFDEVRRLGGDMHYNVEVRPE